MRAFFVQKFVQSQNVTGKNAFLHKIYAFNADEIDGRTVSPIRPVVDPNFYPVGNYHIWNILSK